MIKTTKQLNRLALTYSSESPRQGVTIVDTDKVCQYSQVNTALKYFRDNENYWTVHYSVETESTDGELLVQTNELRVRTKCFHDEISDLLKDEHQQLIMEQPDVKIRGVYWVATPIYRDFSPDTLNELHKLSTRIG